MDILREWVDNKYLELRDKLFDETKDDPERAHHIAIEYAQRLGWWGDASCGLLPWLLLNHGDNHRKTKVEICNAAGMNKNGEIPPKILKHLGFDRVVIGTVTLDPWEGNKERPRVWRFPPQSLVNYLGLPGVGAKRVEQTLLQYGHTGVPLIINTMSTPGKVGDEAVLDILGTIHHLSYFTEDFEINISCPNTHAVTTNYQRSLDDLLRPICLDLATRGKKGYLKVSPDVDHDGVRQILAVASQYDAIRGFVVANTTRQRIVNGIPEDQKLGGASGDAVYAIALKAQWLFADEIATNYAHKDWEIHACGGIRTAERVKQRMDIGNVTRLQVYTPLIYEGPGLIRTIRKAAA